MYGGDWPFALLAGNSYTEIWRDLRACLDGLDHADRHAVLAGTAERVYRLSSPVLPTLPVHATCARYAHTHSRTAGDLML